jgi:hypothetical protein
MSTTPSFRCSFAVPILFHRRHSSFLLLLTIASIDPENGLYIVLRDPTQRACAPDELPTISKGLSYITVELLRRRRRFPEQGIWASISMI